MNTSVIWALVRKDLYLMRGFIYAAIGTGLLALLLMALGRVGFAVGGILFLTANVASGIFIAMYSYITERKDQSRLFALALPVSGRDYELAKLTAAWACYFIPWLVLTGAALTLFLLPPGEHRGMIVYGLLIQGFVLALFSVILASLTFVTSETGSGMVILVTNIAFSLFMVSVNQPDVAGPLRGPRINWTPTALWGLSLEALALLAALALSLVMLARKRDYL